MKTYFYGVFHHMFLVLDAFQTSRSHKQE